MTQQRQRRRGTWADRLINILLVSGVQSTPLDLLVDLTDSENVTVDRMIVHLSIVPSDESTNEQGNQRIDVGIGVVSSEAFAVATLPDPVQSGDYPIRGWLYRDSYAYMRQNSSTFGVEDYMYPTVRADLRASRRVEKGVLMVVFDNLNSFGSAMSVRVLGIIRTHVLLP